MFVTKLKIVVVMVLVIGVAAGGVLTQAWTADTPAETNAEDPRPKPAGGDKKTAEPVAVKVVKPKKGGLPLMVTRPADVVAAQQQQVVPLISGTIKEVRVDIGDRVKKGQVLLVLDAPLLVKDVEEAEAALELAQAQVEEAKTNVAEAEQAVRDHLAGPSKRIHAMASLTAAKARQKLAQAAFDKARIQESFMQLKAAFDGVVTRRTADVGNYVQPSDSRLLLPLLTVQCIDQVRFMTRVSDNHASLIKRDLPVKIEIPGVHGREYKISRFSPSLEGNNREMTVEIDVPNADNQLLPGMLGNVKLPLQKTSPDSLIVPAACVVSQGQGFGQGVISLVYIVRDGKTYLKPVTVRSQDSENAEITTGIHASDLVITDYQGVLRDGTPVKIEKAP